MYDLSFNPRPRLLGSYLLFLPILCLLSWGISVVAFKTFPIGVPGVGGLYYASIFYALITYWFGGWGLLASFLGALFGTARPELPWKAAILYSLADVWEPLIPFLYLRLAGIRRGLDPLASNVLESPRNTARFLGFGAILPPLASGLWAATVLLLSNQILREEFFFTLLTWWAGAALLLALGVPLIGKFISPVMRRHDLACHGIWT